MWIGVYFRFFFATYDPIPLWCCGVRISRVAEGRRACKIGRFRDQVAGGQALSNETDVWDSWPCSPAATPLFLTVSKRSSADSCVVRYLIFEDLHFVDEVMGIPAPEQLHVLLVVDELHALVLGHRALHVLEHLVFGSSNRELPRGRDGAVGGVGEPAYVQLAFVRLEDDPFLAEPEVV